MTSQIVEGNLTFDFPSDWLIEKVDSWDFYRKKFIKISNATKSVDIVAISEQGCIWLIEVKDYRDYKRTKDVSIPNEFCLKIKNTLAMLVSANFKAGVDEKIFANTIFVKGHSIYAVLHLEQKSGNKLFAKPYKPVDLLQAVKRRLKPIFNNTLIVDIATSRNDKNVQWNVN